MNHFIQLPGDSKIINVANVESVDLWGFDTLSRDSYARLTMKSGEIIDDLDNAVYYHFQSIAQQIPEASDE